MKENRNNNIWTYIFFNKYCMYGLLPPGGERGILNKYKLSPLQKEFIESLSIKIRNE